MLSTVLVRGQIGRLTLQFGRFGGRTGQADDTGCSFVCKGAATLCLKSAVQMSRMTILGVRMGIRVVNS